MFIISREYLVDKKRNKNNIYFRKKYGFLWYAKKSSKKLFI